MQGRKTGDNESRSVPGIYCRCAWNAAKTSLYGERHDTPGREQAIYVLYQLPIPQVCCGDQHFENIRKKPNASKHCDGGPTKNLLPERKEASGKM